MTKPLFLSLVSSAFGHDAVFDSPLDRQQWEDLFAQAKKHALLGPLFDVVDDFPARLRPPLAIYARWALAVEEIEASYAAHAELSARLHETFSRGGMRACVLKGQGIAALYPRPEHRQSGDIDLWVEGGREKVLSYLSGVCKVRSVVYHHCDAAFSEEVPVEVHFTPSWMNSLRLNRRLQRWFASEADSQFSNGAGSILASTTAEFNAVFCLVHIFRHLFAEGIGLRQLMDYRYILQALPSSSHAEVMDTVRSLKLDRFAAALMYVQKEVFLLPDEQMLCEPDPGLGEFFLDEVMRAGNFGRYDARNAHGPHESLPARAWRKISRLARLLRFCPEEVLCAPLFKTWQLLWRRCHNYL